MHIYIYICADMCKYVTLYIMVAEIIHGESLPILGGTVRHSEVAQFEEMMTHGSPPVPMNSMVFYGNMGKIWEKW